MHDFFFSPRSPWWRVRAGGSGYDRVVKPHLRQRLVYAAAIALCVAARSPESQAAPKRLEELGWSWNTSFTAPSDPAMIALQSRIMESSIGIAGQGVPVENLTFKAPGLQVHLVQGTIWPEAAVEGYPAGAWFEGAARVEFDPSQAKARSDLLNHFGAESLHDLPVSWVYLFTLRGTPLTKQLGSAAEPSVPTPSSSSEYSIAKATMRQAGTELLHAFLNRDGSSKDGAWVLFAPESIRKSGDGDAALLYSYDPSRERLVELSVFGHSGAFTDPDVKRYLEAFPAYKYSFVPVAWVRREPNSKWIPTVDVEKYSISMSFTRNLGETREEAVVTFTPAVSVSALQINMTNRLAVESVAGPNGEPYPFVQWRFLSDKANFDETLVVRPPSPLEPGKPTSIKVVSKGPLFDRSSYADALAEEDTWYPRINDRDGALYETAGTTLKPMRFVAAGKQIAEVVGDKDRTARFATTRPAFGSSFYVGDFDVRETKAEGGTRIQVYVDRNTGSNASSSDTEYAAQEVANAVGIYNKILDAPLETETLRAVTTPTGHGRGFEGLLLLAAGGALSNQSFADFFRAHEVAHQWWGNMIQSDAWPEDRWLGESFADFTAMEFYKLRFEKPDKAREQMRDRWLTPLQRATQQTILTLDGQQRQVDGSELFSLSDGTENVYTKGPLVLNQLRYLFVVMKRNEDDFWILLQDLLAKNKYKRVSTADFTAMAEEKIGGKLGWFWDQWLYGTKIPKISWSNEVTEDRSRGDFLITVRGAQEDTSFQLAVPVYVTMKSGRTLIFPLLFNGKEGKAEARSKEKPTKISLNDNYEAPVWLKN